MLPRSLFFSLTLTFWLGLYALRSYVPAAVWNLADELPMDMKAVLAVMVNIVALAGIALFYKAPRRALVPLAIAFATLCFLRQLANASDAAGPWLSFASWIVFVWLLAAHAKETAAQKAERMIAPALAAAFALQLGMQSAWHGLDLHVAQGVIPLAGITVLSLLLVMSVLRVPPPVEQPTRSSWGWLLVGPAMFLLATLSANAGRLAELSGLAFPGVIICAQVTLMLGALAAGRALPFGLRIIIIGASALAVVFALNLRGASALLLLLPAFVVLLGLGNLAERRVRVSPAVAIGVTILLFFALLFGFYYAYEFTPLWPLALVPFLIAAALPLRAAPFHGRALLLPWSVAFVLALLFLVPALPRSADAEDGLDILSYNIHHGFDNAGMPGMQRIAQEIERMQPDLAALQEVSRGWTVVGGVDLVTYLRWRFPHYQTVFVALDGQLWGNAIMSRLPIVAHTRGLFDAEPGVLQYGWLQAMIQLEDRHLEFYSVHLTADPAGPQSDPRVPQARRLVEQVGRAPLIVVAGDFNAQPGDEPIRIMRTALRDLGAEAGLGEIRTWPAGTPRERLDYIFARGVDVRSGRIPATLASDHLPVLVRIVPRDTTAFLAESSNPGLQPGVNP